VALAHLPGKRALAYMEPTRAGGTAHDPIGPNMTGQFVLVPPA